MSARVANARTCTTAWIEVAVLMAFALPCRIARAVVQRGAPPTTSVRETRALATSSAGQVAATPAHVEAANVVISALITTCGWPKRTSAREAIA